METAVNTGIKASELRIGNYLQTQLTHRQKQTIQPLIVVADELKHLKPALTYMQGKHRTMYTTHLFYRELQPIPLTPELLLKCGFLKEDNFYYRKWVAIPELNDSEDLYITESGENAFKLAQYFDGFYIDYGLPFSYVHQLQNLFFSLLHRELEVPF